MKTHTINIDQTFPAMNIVGPYSVWPRPKADGFSAVPTLFPLSHKPLANSSPIALNRI
jgi:hypothetical protein